MGSGPGPANRDTIHYKIKGQSHFATIDSDTFGIPADLIVKGMEGIKTTIPAFVQMMGVPANIVRKFVTRGPGYAVRQLIRDPVNAFLLSGVDGVPVLSSLKELAKMRAGTSVAEKELIGGLAISSNVFSGNEKDMQKFLEDISTGKGAWRKLMAAMDTFALQADTATRATIYQDSLNKGMSLAKAQFRTHESQNFSRRGLSPSMQMLSTMIPFFHSQIQGLDVLYRTLKGTMPFSEQLEIKRKLYMRGLLLTIGIMAYAALMQDDDAYKKATPEERYSNLFLPLPGLKEPFKIPMPYEAGFLFMALPQAVIDIAFRDTKARDAIIGIGKTLMQSTPGVLPAGAKPLIEAAYGSTSVGAIESAREKKLMAESRYKDNTPEALRIAGQLTGMAGVSPIMLTHLVRGYTGGLGVSLLSVFDPLLSSGAEGERASVPLSKMPFIGTLFQSTEGRGIIDSAYNHMDRLLQIKGTYDDLRAKGQRAEAEAFAQRYANELSVAGVSGNVHKRLGELFTMERKVRAHPNMTTAKKDDMIEKIKAEENRIAEQFEKQSYRTTPQ
jgi:hypothetical protein